MSPAEAEEGPACWRLEGGILWEDEGGDGDGSNGSGLGGGPGSSVSVYEFERAFGPASTQRDIYTQVQPIVRSALAGYNGVIFAYGQTGSGKTYTMQGPAEAPGVIPHALTEVFQTAAAAGAAAGEAGAVPRRTFEFALSYVELYNEDLLDLLHENDNQSGGEEDTAMTQSKPLLVREDAERGVHIQGVTEVSVTSYAHAARALAAGEKRRHVAATQLNRYSSRSHTILKLIIISRPVEGEDEDCYGGAGGGSGGVMRSELLLVDLAGSERAKRRGKHYEVRFTEGCHINMSLLALGRVIRQLAAGASGHRNASEGGGGGGGGNGVSGGGGDNTANQHVPFRDSRLTRLLEPALGGSARTAVIACISPAAEMAEDSRSTLRFAERCTLVQNHAKLNHAEAGVQLKEALRRAQAEADELRRQLSALAMEGGAGGGDTAAAAAAAGLAREGQKLRRRLAEVEAENANLRTATGNAGAYLAPSSSPASSSQRPHPHDATYRDPSSGPGGSEGGPIDRCAAAATASGQSPPPPPPAQHHPTPATLNVEGIEAMVQQLMIERDDAVADAKAARIEARAGSQSAGGSSCGGGNGRDSEVEEALMAECARLRGEVLRARAAASDARRDAAAATAHAATSSLSLGGNTNGGGAGRGGSSGGGSGGADDAASVDEVRELRAALVDSRYNPPLKPYT
jgi:hypothetical protein